VFDYASRRRQLAQRLDAEGIDMLFLGPSADLEYLSGAERGIPGFGQIAYAHGWAAGGFFFRDREPVFVLPRMARRFELAEWAPPGELVVVDETDDGPGIFASLVRGLGSPSRVAVGDRVWAEAIIELGRVVGFDRLEPGSRLVNELRRVKSTEELDAMTRAVRAAEQTMAAVTPLVVAGVTMAELNEEVEHQLLAHGSRTISFATHTFTGHGPGSLDATRETAREPLPEGTTVMFDFGGVVDGYCSDFGRTVYCGEPPGEVREAYELLLAAQEAGRSAAVPGALACDVNAACRAPIEAAGLGECFGHRMGHGIGLDVHEQPFISPEDETPLEPGMTFTDEPSIIVRGRYGSRIEDIVVCADGGARKLGSYPAELVSGASE
jgi:Xaa-Pro aminopeptidase